MPRPAAVTRADIHSGVPAMLAGAADHSALSHFAQQLEGELVCVRLAGVPSPDLPNARPTCARCGTQRSPSIWTMSCGSSLPATTG